MRVASIWTRSAWASILVTLCAGVPRSTAQTTVSEVDANPELLVGALERAGENRVELEAALAGVPDEQRFGMRFLIEHMPDHDLESLDRGFLIENVELAFRAWQESAWRDQIPREIFLNDVLPYASVNERRDNWRREFYERFRPLVEEADSAAEAAAILNQKVFPELGVRYSRDRRKPDQSPFESIETGTASCTGLSVVLVDACRAVGVPARMVGTPLWSDRSGNHSWVEVWDDGWHFTGACEATGLELDRAWFVGRASQAQRDHPLHAIYAVSYRRTPIHFPLVWDRSIDYVHAVNVTDRYVERAEPVPEGSARVMFQVVERLQRRRHEAELQVVDTEGDTVFSGVTKDERFDGNDHLAAILPLGAEYVLTVRAGDREIESRLRVEQNDQLVTLELPPESD